MCARITEPRHDPVAGEHFVGLLIFHIKERLMEHGFAITLEHAFQPKLSATLALRLCFIVKVVFQVTHVIRALIRAKPNHAFRHGIATLVITGFTDQLVAKCFIPNRSQTLRKAHFS